MFENKLKCLDPDGLGRMLNDFKLGAFDINAQPNRTKDAQRFYAHTEQCPACHEAVINHINETVTIPAIKRKAAELGVSYRTLMKEIGKVVDAGQLPT